MTTLQPRQPVCTGTAGRRPGLLARMRERAAERRYLEECSAYAAAVRWEFRDACEAVRVCQWIDTPTGMFIRTPRVGHVTVGPPTTFTVELMPGQRCSDIAAEGRRIAESLGAHGLRVESLAGRFAKVTLLDTDPLAAGFNLPPLLLDTVQALAILGRDEGGDTLGFELASAVHVAVEGMTRSGKSRFLQMLLAQLGGAVDLIVSGIDHTDLLLGRAWEHTVHRAWQSTGSEPTDVAAHADHLDELVRRMRARRAELGRYEDKVTTGPDMPLVCVVLEEFPQLLDLADSLPKPAKGQTVGARLRSAVKQLVAEGAKYGYRVIMIAQRFEGSAVGGVYVRDQFGLAISFSVPADSLRFLHGDQVDKAVAEEHSQAPAGIALVSGRGRSLTRFRAPALPGGYAEFVERIETTARRAAA